MARIDLVALQQRLAHQQPTPVPAELPPLKARPAIASAVAPAGTLRATTTMRAALPLKAPNTRADRAEERAMVKALRAQIDELKTEMAVASAEADQALAEERQRAARLNEQVETLSDKVVQAEKRAEAAVGQAERAEAGRDAERARAVAESANLQRDLDAARAEAERLEHDRAAASAIAGEVVRTAEGLRQADDERKARGLVARLRAAWRGE